MNLTAFLRSLPLFSSLSDELIAGIGTLAVTSSHPAGAVIFSEHEPAGSVYAVVDGKVTIVKRLGPAQEKTLAILTPGSVFGESAFISTSPRTATAVTKIGATLIALPHDAFHAWIQAHPAAGVAVLSGMLAISMNRIERTSRELATVYEVGKLISASASLTGIAQGILDQLRLAVPEIASGIVYIYNEFNDEFDAMASTEDHGEKPPLPPHDPLADRARTHMPDCVIDDRGAAGALVLAPVVKGPVFLGFITVQTKGTPALFDHNLTILLSAVCGAFAEAIENIRHRQEEHDRQRLSSRNL
jgi:CRP-like cAMP-binding protein